jgi:hypothetical protein
LPSDGFVIGEPVSVIEFDYDGNERRGLTALCRREDGSEHAVAAADIVLPKRSNGARCRLPGSERVVTLRASRLWDVIPGEIVLVTPRKQWTYAGHPYLSGEIESTRLDVPALGLVPLRLVEQGVWDPDKEYWGEEGEPIEEWANPIIARGPRPAFEMEQVLPGEDPDDPFEDPITKSNDLKTAGDFEGAYKMLMELCQADLRCLDAHSHLGNFAFDRRPEEAIRHYEVGLRIGELSLGDGFEGVLRWGFIDNRPFLRCMHGFGLCLWRLGRFEEAERVFDRILWLNPSDNQAFSCSGPDGSRRSRGRCRSGNTSNIFTSKGSADLAPPPFYPSNDRSRLEREKKEAGREAKRRPAMETP